MPIRLIRGTCLGEQAVEDIISLRVEKAADMNCDAIEPGNMMVSFKIRIRAGRTWSGTNYNKYTVIGLISYFAVLQDHITEVCNK